MSAMPASSSQSSLRDAGISTRKTANTERKSRNLQRLRRSALCVLHEGRPLWWAARRHVIDEGQVLEAVRAEYQTKSIGFFAALGYLEAIAKDDRVNDYGRGLAARYASELRTEYDETAKEIWADVRKPLLRAIRKFAPAALAGMMLMTPGAAHQAEAKPTEPAAIVAPAQQAHQPARGIVQQILAWLSAALGFGWLRRFVRRVRTDA